MRKTLAALLIAAGCASQPTVPAEPCPPPKYAIIKRLCINDSKTRTFCQIPESEGIAQMAHLSRLSTKEEAWLYVPEDKIFIEVGHPMSQEDKQTLLEAEQHHGAIAVESVSLDVPYLSGVLMQHKPKQVSLYHIHPEKVLTERVEHPHRLQFLQLTLPSRMDLAGAMNRIARIHDAVGTVLTEHVVSPYGVSSISLTNEGLQRYKQMDKEKLIADADTLYTPILDKEDLEGITSSSLAKELSNEYVTVTYRPHK